MHFYVKTIFAAFQHGIDMGKEGEFSEVIDVSPGKAITIPRRESIFNFATQNGSLYLSFVSIVLSGRHMVKKQRVSHYQFQEYGNSQTIVIP